MRKCKFNMPEYKQIKNDRGYYSHTEVIDHWENGFFHQWGCNYEEFDSGPGNYSIGIVETEDGKIYEPSPVHIIFLDEVPT